jgi:hypothetical protein
VLSVSMLFELEKEQQMELTSQYTSTSVGTLSQDARAEPVQSALAQPGQPRMFAESDTAFRFAVGRDDQQHYATADGAHSREKRGAVLGACAKSEFRECRGGEALKDGASSYMKFDQFENKETRGEEGRGTCDGIVHEAMRRLDLNSGGTDLPSAVTHMSSEINGGRRTANQVMDRILVYQDNPERLGLRNYRQTSRRVWNPSSGATRDERINGLIHNMGTSPGIPPGGFAYIGVRVQREGEAARQYGHVLLVQRLPQDAHGADRYAIFDPNNGVFTYDNWQHTQAALRGYMDSAYSEDGYNAVPDLVRFYTPGRGMQNQPVAAANHRHDDLSQQGEPPELQNQPYLGHDEL